MLNTRTAGRLALALLAAAATLGAPAAMAQDYPTKPIEMIVPTAPGGGGDVVARILAGFLEPRLGQPIIVQNMTGAQNLQGARHVAMARPDGYTIMVTPSSPPGFKAIYKEPPVDPLNDYAFVSLILKAPQILAVNQKYADVAALIAASQADPNGVVYASYAIGFELMGAVLDDRLGINSRVAYFSSAQDAAKAVAAGDADYMMASQATLRPWGENIRSAMITQAEASDAFPGIPTAAEVGAAVGAELPDILIWIGVFAPAGTPEPIVARLNAEVRAFTEDPAMQAELAKFGFGAFANSPEEFREFFAIEEQLMLDGAAAAGFEKR